MKGDYIIKTITLNEIANLPPLSDYEITDAINFVNSDFSDCPKQTKEELAKFKSLKESKPKIYKAISKFHKYDKK